MEHPEIFSATLGLSHPWQITSIDARHLGKRLDIMIDFATDWSFTCPQCGSSMLYTATEQEIWHHDDFFHHETYLHARVPKTICSKCGMVDIERPWSRTGSKFVLFTG